MPVTLYVKNIRGGVRSGEKLPARIVRGITNRTSENKHVTLHAVCQYDNGLTRVAGEARHVACRVSRGAATSRAALTTRFIIGPCY